jgi:hypothetical protein
LVWVLSLKAIVTSTHPLQKPISTSNNFVSAPNVIDSAPEEYVPLLIVLIFQSQKAKFGIPETAHPFLISVQSSLCLVLVLLKQDFNSQN